MKNLKNMLFAAAIGAVLVPIAASAKNITADATITSSNINDYKNEVLVVKAGKTLTVNSGVALTNADGKCSVADKTTKAACEAQEVGGTWTAASIKLEKGAKLVNYSADTTIVPNAEGDNLVIYTMKDAAKTYVADTKLNLGNSDKAKTIYYEAKGEEITIAAPEILGTYRTAIDGTGYDVKDKKAVIAKENAGDTSTITVKFNSGNADDEVVYTVKLLKKAGVNEIDGTKKVTENQAAVDAIYADYISVMNNDKANKVFAVKGLTAGALTSADLDIDTQYGVNPDATTKSAIEKVVSGLTKINDEIKYFTATATVGGATITDISSTGKKFTVTVDTGLTDVVVPEGKALYVINYHVDNANTAANIVDKNAKLDENGKLTFTTNQFSTFAVAIGDKVAETPATPAQTTDKDTKEANTGDATKEANPKTSDNVMTSVVSLLVSAFGLTAAGLKLKNN